MKTWVDELKSNGPSDIILAIVGNKIDRYDDEEVSYADVKEYASQVGAILKLVSAKEGKNITVINLLLRTSSLRWQKWRSEQARPRRPTRAGPRSRTTRTRGTTRRKNHAADYSYL